MINRWNIQDKSGEFRFNVDLVIKADSVQKFQDLLFELKHQRGIDFDGATTELVNGSMRFDKPSDDLEYYNYDYINDIWDTNNSHHIVKTSK